MSDSSPLAYLREHICEVDIGAFLHCKDSKVCFVGLAYSRGGEPFVVCVPKSAKSMTKFFRVSTKNCGEGSEFWGPVAAFPPNWGIWSAADTALFAAIWHQKHIRVKLNNGC